MYLSYFTLDFSVSTVPQMTEPQTTLVTALSHASPPRASPPGSGITIIYDATVIRHSSLVPVREAQSTNSRHPAGVRGAALRAGRSATLHAPSRLGPRELEHYDLLSIEARDVDLVAVNMDCSDITF